MGLSFTNRSGKIRLYDGTAVTPQFLEIDFDAGDFSGPLGIPRPEEILKLNRGLSDANAHYIGGSDDKIYEPMELSLSCLLTDLTQTGYIVDWLNAMNDGGTTQVNSKTLLNTKEDTNRDGTNTSPPFADSDKMCCNVEILWDGATDWGLQYNEVYFPIEQGAISEGDDAVTLAITGFVYGTVEEISVFTTGATVE